MKRVLEIDLIKVLALLLMPMSHIFDELGNYYNLMNNIPQNYTEQLGILFMNIPTLFMICLGFGIVLSQNSTPEKLVKRGLFMFLAEAVLNLFRIILPHFTVSYYTGIPSYFKESFELFFMSDILLFAGFAFLFFALVKKLNLSNKFVLIIGLFCTFIQTFIPHPSIQNVYLKYLTGYFIYVDESSFFPVISWLIYPIIGYLLGQKLLETSNRTSFYLKTVFFALFIFVLTNIYLFFTNSMQARYYLFMEMGFQMDLFTTLIVSSISVMILSLSHFIGKLFVNSKLKDLISSISANVNSVYCIHWVLVKILWAIAIIFAFKIEYYSLFVIGFVIFVLSSMLAHLRKIINKKGQAG